VVGAGGCASGDCDKQSFSAFALIRRASSCRESFSIIEAFFSGIEDRRGEGGSGHHGEKTDAPLLAFH
jgi:hypothetical protein